MPIAFEPVIPILRSFDEAKAKEFYVGFLGFTLDWKHRFDKNAPLYMQVSRGSLILHLSEHHGDASPGASLMVRMTGVADLHREVTARKYKYGRPGLEKTPWKTRSLTVHDPFGNRIRFEEEISREKKHIAPKKSPKPVRKRK